MPISAARMKLYPGGSIRSPEWLALRGEILARLAGCTADLAVLPDPPADDADPLVAAIVAADLATVAHKAILVGQNEDDE